MKIYAILVTAIAVGLGLLLASSHLGETHWSHVWLHDLATVILISGVFGIVDKAILNHDEWERLSHLFGVHDSVQRTGLKQVAIDSTSFDYGPMIRDGSNLRIVLNDGRTWISDKITHLQERFKEKSETEFYLMNPANPVIPQLAEKTGYSKDEQRDKVRQAVKRLVEAFDQKEKQGVLRIYYLKYYPTHSIFMTDKEVVITLYGISHGRRPVPAFVFDKEHYGNFVYKHIEDDVKNIREESTCVFDSGRQPRFLAGSDFDEEPTKV
jgi:hypothetical protein